MVPRQDRRFEHEAIRIPHIRGTGHRDQIREEAIATLPVAVGVAAHAGLHLRLRVADLLHARDHPGLVAVERRAEQARHHEGGTREQRCCGAEGEPGHPARTRSRRQRRSCDDGAIDGKVHAAISAARGPWPSGIRGQNCCSGARKHRPWHRYLRVGIRDGPAPESARAVTSAAARAARCSRATCPRRPSPSSRAPDRCRWSSR